MILLATGLVLLLVPVVGLFIITFFPRKSDRIAGKSCAVTGASEGIGAVIALHLAQAGVKRLVLGARRMEKLEKVKADILKQIPKAEVILMKLDVRDAESRKNFTAVCNQKQCNILVNNAGVDRNAFFEKMTDDHIDQMLETNLSCCVKLTRDFVKFFLEASGGHVVNVSSVAGQMPVPFGAVYATSKAGLRNFTASLRAEMKYYKKPVKLHSVSPGLVVDAGLAADREERLGTTIRKAAGIFGWTTPLRVAEAVVQAVEYDEPDLVVNFPPVRLPFAVMFLFPRTFETAIYLTNLIGIDTPVKYFRKDAEYEAAHQ